METIKFVEDLEGNICEFRLEICFLDEAKDITT